MRTVIRNWNFINHCHDLNFLLHFEVMAVVQVNCNVFDLRLQIVPFLICQLSVSPYTVFTFYLSEPNFAQGTERRHYHIKHIIIIENSMRSPRKKYLHAQPILFVSKTVSPHPVSFYHLLSRVDNTVLPWAPIKGSYNAATGHSPWVDSCADIGVSRLRWGSSKVGGAMYTLIKCGIQVSTVSH